PAADGECVTGLQLSATGTATSHKSFKTDRNERWVGIDRHERRNPRRRWIDTVRSSFIFDLRSFYVDYKRKGAAVARRSGPAEIPYDAKDALLDLGRNLRTARLRRNMTLE